MGALAKKTATTLPVNARVELDRLEQEFGGRQHLVQALTFARQTKDVRYLLGLVADPENNSRALADILKDGRILPGELVAALASGTELRSQLIAKQHVARRIPKVVAEVMEKAAEYEADCTECLGIGTLVDDPSAEVPNPAPRECPVCRGAKRLLFPADGKCRDLALEMSGLVGSGGGSHVQVNVSQQTAVFQGGSYEGYERMQEAMDQVLYGAGAVPPIDAEATVITPETAETPDSPQEPES